MEYRPEKNLAEQLLAVPRDRIPMLIPRIASAARFMMEERSTVHRDIKPSNIVVDGQFERPILLDLGVIRPIGKAGPTDQYQQDFVGTLQYGPPEFVFRTEEDTPEGWRAVTFYQLGAVLHDMIMQKPLFQEYTVPYTRLVRAVETETPTIEAPNVAPRVLLLARNCLVKKPALRLDLVEWGDFDEAKLNNNQPLRAKERVRERMSGLKAGPLVMSSLEEQHLCLVERRLAEDVRGRVAHLVWSECVYSGMFPPVQVHDNVPEAGLLTKIGWEQSSRLGIPAPISIWIKVVVTDLKSKIVEVEWDVGSETAMTSTRT